MDNLFAKLSALAPSGVGAAAPAESTPQDIPKEELMTLCMKMNKRMQAMEAKGKEIMKKKTTLTAERQKMLDLFRMVISVPTITKEDADLDLNALEQSWADFELRRRDQLTDLQARLVAKDQLMQQSLKAMEDHYKTTIADMRAGGGNNDPQTAEGEGADNSNKGTSIDAIIEAEKEKMVCI